jgi:DNA-binding MarR family transcriptional regulator
MKLAKLFGSKTKADILKYLVFRRQGISVRAFEAELQWSFPAIKKQIDSLEEAGVVTIIKNSNKRSIFLTDGLGEYMRNLLIYSLKTDLSDYFAQYEMMLRHAFRGKMFGVEVDMDLVLIYTPEAQLHLEKIKSDINDIFRTYLIEMVSVVFMSQSDFEKRYRLADRFVLTLMRENDVKSV